MVVFGIIALGIGIAMVTTLLIANQFWMNIRWFLIVVGIVAIL